MGWEEGVGPGFQGGEGLGLARMLADNGKCSDTLDVVYHLAIHGLENYVI